MALITKDGDQAEKTVDAPKIEFPCDNYVIKIVALDEEGSYEVILAAMMKHAPEMDASQVATNRSSKGRFVSYSFRIVATSEQQLADLHKDLMSVPAVKMVM